MNKNYLEEIINDKGLSAAKLSKLSGVSTSTISKIINNKLKKITDDTIQKIATALDVTEKEIFEGGYVTIKEQTRLYKEKEERKLLQLSIKITNEYFESQNKTSEEITFISTELFFLLKKLKSLHSEELSSFEEELKSAYYNGEAAKCLLAYDFKHKIIENS